MNLDPIFYPQSIAVIGASTKEKTVGNDVVKNLTSQGYQGKLYLVNPKADELYGQKVYHDISEIDEDIDLAVVAIPAAFVPKEIEKASLKNLKAAIVISAGFKEAGNLELEQELRKTCDKYNVVLVGPNCLGALNPEISLNASFAMHMPEAGNVAFMSQSGALCTSVIDYARDMHVGFSKFISIGNKAGINELDLIEYLGNDPKTKVILIYAEELKDAKKFIETAKKVTCCPNPKPIIIIKSGKTTEGSQAVASHTGSLAGGDSAYEALFNQSGIVRANSISELFDYAQVFSKNIIQNVQNIAIVTNAGGPGVLTTDKVIESGLKLAKLEPQTEEKLKQVLPAAANTHNPIDVLGDAKAESYDKTLQILSQDKNIEGLLILLTPQSMTEIEETAQAILNFKKTCNKPIVVSFMGGESVEKGVELLQKNNIATNAFPEPAAKSLSVLSQFYAQTLTCQTSPFTYEDVDKQKVAQIFAKAKENGQTSFPEAQAMEIMRAYNFPLLKTAKARNPDEAFQIASDFNCQLAMKIVSPDILHKSDVGGVMLNINRDNVRQKYEEMFAEVSAKKPEANLQGVYLMEMAPDTGKEFILGANKAGNLGTTIMFGLGGIFVEVFKDVTFGIVPIARQDAQKMIESIKSNKIINGTRGQVALDKNAIIECLGRLNQLLSDFPEIIELDINPLMALPEGQGAKVLDARIVIK